MCSIVELHSQPDFRQLASQWQIRIVLLLLIHVGARVMVPDQHMS